MNWLQTLLQAPIVQRLGWTLLHLRTCTSGTRWTWHPWARQRVTHHSASTAAEARGRSRHLANPLGELLREGGCAGDVCPHCRRHTNRLGGILRKSVRFTVPHAIRGRQRDAVAEEKRAHVICRGVGRHPH